MKKGMCLFVILLLCGCIYEVPVVEEAVIPVDPALTGTWQEIPDEGKLADSADRMVVLAFSANEYIVAFSPTDDAIYYRAYLIKVDDLMLVQLKMLELAGDKKKSYLVCRYAVQDGILTVETLNADVVSDDIKDSAALRETLLANRDNPDLFKEQSRYRKLED